MAQIKVGVVGAGGSLGRATCVAVALDNDLELVAAIDRKAVGETRHGIQVTGDLRSLADARCDVVVDFTVAEPARVTCPKQAMPGMHAAVLMTGLTDDYVAAFRSEFSVSNCAIVPNFSIS